MTFCSILFAGCSLAMTEDSWSLCTHVQPSQQDETFDEPLQELDKLMKDNAAPDINQELFCNMHKVTLIKTLDSKRNALALRHAIYQ